MMIVVMIMNRVTMTRFLQVVNGVINPINGIVNG